MPGKMSHAERAEMMVSAIESDKSLFEMADQKVFILSNLTAVDAEAREEERAKWQQNMDAHREALVGNLAMLVRRLSHRLRKHTEHVDDNKLADQADDFLKRSGQAGSILREESRPEPLTEARADERAKFEPKWTTDWSTIKDDGAYLCAAINNKQDGTGIYLSNFHALKGWEVKRHMKGCYAVVEIGWPKTIADFDRVESRPESLPVVPQCSNPMTPIIPDDGVDYNMECWTVSESADEEPCKTECVDSCCGMSAKEACEWAWRKMEEGFHVRLWRV